MRKPPGKPDKETAPLEETSRYSPSEGLREKGADLLEKSYFGVRRFTAALDFSPWSVRKKGDWTTACKGPVPFLSGRSWCDQKRTVKLNTLLQNSASPFVLTAATHQT
jgi:hypothetical protein